MDSIESHVVAMPYPGRGHFNPMMNLCKRLIRRYPNLIVTFVVTEECYPETCPDPFLNSTLEGIYSGVPMLTFPLFCDQILNAKVIVEDWKVGMRIERKKETKLLIGRNEIKEVVKRFMDRESEEGKEMRRRACDLSEISRGAVVERGSSNANIDDFVSRITTQ